MMVLASVSGRCCAAAALQQQQQRVTQETASSSRGLRVDSFTQPRRGIFRQHRQQLRQSRLVLTNATNGASIAAQTVADVMNTSVISVRAETTLDEALELLVLHKVSGLPVVDENNVVVGVVSDFDLLPLEALGSLPAAGTNMFPDVNTDWKAFNDLSIALQKNAGKNVADVMTPEPLVVRPATGLVDAAQILLKSRVRRLPVVDAQGKLTGIMSRSNVIKAALEHRRELKAL